MRRDYLGSPSSPLGHATLSLAMTKRYVLVTLREKTGCQQTKTNLVKSAFLSIHASAVGSNLRNVQQSVSAADRQRQKVGD